MWKDIEYKDVKRGYYLINENGDIYSKVTHKMKKTRKDASGYVIAPLSIPGNKTRCFCVHDLVCFAFNGPCPSYIKDPTVDHIDFDKSNNNYKNLVWMERKDNSIKHKVTICGEKSNFSLLTEEQVIKICELLATTKLHHGEIAEICGVNKKNVDHIRCGDAWVRISSKYMSLINANRGEKGTWHRTAHT